MIVAKLGNIRVKKISDKNQFTFPYKFLDKLGIGKGDEVAVILKDDHMIIAKPDNVQTEAGFYE